MVVKNAVKSRVVTSTPMSGPLPPFNSSTASPEDPDSSSGTSFIASTRQSQNGLFSIFEKKTTTFTMICEAIEKVGTTKKGASVQAIKKYILGNYGNLDPGRQNLFTKKALIKGLENGTLCRPPNSVQATSAIGFFLVTKKKPVTKKTISKKTTENLKKKKSNSASAEAEKKVGTKVSKTVKPKKTSPSSDSEVTMIKTNRKSLKLHASDSELPDTNRRDLSPVLASNKTIAHAGVGKKNKTKPAQKTDSKPGPKRAKPGPEKSTKKKEPVEKVQAKTLKKQLSQEPEENKTKTIKKQLSEEIEVNKTKTLKKQQSQETEGNKTKKSKEKKNLSVTDTVGGSKAKVKGATAGDSSEDFKAKRKAISTKAKTAAQSNKEISDNGIKKIARSKRTTRKGASEFDSEA